MKDTNKINLMKVRGRYLYTISAFADIYPTISINSLMLRVEMENTS